MNKISFRHYEVGLFAEYNAKTYIKTRLKRLNVSITSVVTGCIDEQFKEIKRIFSKEEALSFLGYAPVLDALATAYDNDRNTINLLKDTASGENNCNLMNRILKDLLIREHSKFIKALIVKIPNIGYNRNLDVLYNNDEQLQRLLGMILALDSTFFTDMNDIIPKEFYEEYLETINTQLPQHPFIRAKENPDRISYDFTGTAFKDFVIAYSLADEILSDFIDDYFVVDPKYCPSQMLIEFYGLLSNNKIKGRYVTLMYNSFKARAQLGDEISVYINGDIDDCSVEFNLTRNKTVVSQMEFSLINLQDGIWVDQLSNCYVDVQGKVYVGTSVGEARICNTTINCEEIIWNSEQITIEAYSPGECALATNKLNFTTKTSPRFEIRTDDKNNLKVYSPELKNYYKLLAYKCDNIFEPSSDNFISFGNLIRRIFSCLRSHSKDTPARKMDFIDNRIINGNEQKKSVLDFLLKEQIIYTDEQDWLYKLDTSMLSKFSINWNEVRGGNSESLEFLYNEYENFM